MFTEITIQNFQSFRDKTISFCEGVNAIVGLSRSGKTTILRAINWCAKNEPRGTAFQSWWGGDPSVRIKFDDGVAVTRRSHLDNHYYLIERPGEKDIELTAFGAKVPEEVERIFNMNSTCLQAQMDGVFFLSLKPGAVAKALNEAVNLNVIDSSVADIRVKKLEADKNLKFQKGELEEKEEKVATFGYLEGLEIEVTKLEGMVRREKSTKDRLDLLVRTIEDLEINERMILQYDKTIAAGVDVSKAIDLNKEAAAVGDDVSNLERLLSRINRCLVSQDKAKAMVAVSGEVAEARKCYEEYISNESDLTSLKNSLLKLEVFRTRLAGFDSDIEGWEKEIKELEDSQPAIERFAAKAGKLREEFKEIRPDKCPLCDSPQKVSNQVGDRP